MKLLLVFSVALVLYVQSSSAGMLDGMASVMGVKVSFNVRLIRKIV